MRGGAYKMYNYIGSLLILTKIAPTKGLQRVFRG